MATRTAKKIIIRSDQRTLIVSPTRQGKSTLAMELLTMIRPSRMVVLNPGAEPMYYKIFGEARRTIDPSFPPVQHVVTPIYTNKKKYDPFLWPQIYEGNVYTFFDELRAVGEANQFPEALMYMYQMGGRRGCGTMALTQRLNGIPKLCLNQAEHLFVGHVQGPDLETLEFETQQKWADLIKNRKPYQWIYWSKDEQEPPRYITRGLTGAATNQGGKNDESKRSNVLRKRPANGAGNSRTNRK